VRKYSQRARVSGICFIRSGTFHRILDVPKMGQYRDPFLNGTLLEVGFGKSFAYKTYPTHPRSLTIFSYYFDIIIYLEMSQLTVRTQFIVS